MPCHRNHHVSILDIEKSLGFKWPQGFSRMRSKSGKFPVMTALLADIERLQRKFTGLPAHELRESDAFEQCVESIFQKHAGQIWAAPSVDTSAWLVDPSVNDWNGRYRNRLIYHNPHHQDT